MTPIIRFWRPGAVAWAAVLLGGAPTIRAGYVAVDLYTLTSPPGLSAPGIDVHQYYRRAVGGQVAPITSSPGGAIGVVLHASLWSNGVYTDLSPAGYGGSSINGICGTQQVGAGGSLSAGAGHAMLWNGTALSAVDLNPAGFRSSEALGTNGTQQVGIGSNADGLHALLWHGSAESTVDLNPAYSAVSAALATDGIHQVGFAGPGFGDHACLWAGTAESAIDLNPKTLGFAHSMALGVFGNQQVGWAYGETDHAILWKGSAASAVDLGTGGYAGAYAFDTNGYQQVGVGAGAGTHALVWEGTADSVIDLGTLLPTGWSRSQAFSADPVGDVFGTAYDARGNLHAVEWVTSTPNPDVGASGAVPEPSALAGLVVGALALWRRRIR